MGVGRRRDIVQVDGGGKGSVAAQSFCMTRSCSVSRCLSQYFGAALTVSVMWPCFSGICRFGPYTVSLFERLDHADSATSGLHLGSLRLVVSVAGELEVTHLSFLHLFTSDAKSAFDLCCPDHKE